ncbi:MAG: 3',5'-cyclic-nucleotide phosphodiesterase [candidate division NC10 bacterium]|nr:3',5'-cyclic-nucleotide phosphodiesterase [candidate division NC10 bacterium]
MRVQALGCFGSEAYGCQPTSLLVNGRLLLDAGSVTASLSLDAQATIDHILITHAHISHVIGLAYLTDNLFGVRSRPLEVWSIPPVIDQLKAHLFNGTLWPDFSILPSPLRPTLSFHELVEGRPHQIGQYEVTAVGVHHTVETAGYAISDGASAILYQGDSGPTTELWRLANRTANLDAVIVETTFPNRFSDHAIRTGHLTPELLRAELAQLKVQTSVYAQHMKPQYFSEIVGELAALSDPPVLPLDQGKTYSFGAP